MDTSAGPPGRARSINLAEVGEHTEEAEGIAAVDGPTRVMTRAGSFRRDRLGQVVSVVDVVAGAPRDTEDSPGWAVLITVDFDHSRLDSP